MPVIKSAKKKLRQDKKREKANFAVKESYRKAVKDAQKSKSLEKVKVAVQLIDKASKKGIIHKNKAARLKSKLSKVAKPEAKTKATTKPAKKSAKPKK
jgi:small subunit ribosomal protein S20